MKSFMLLYSGPATPPNASHEGWPEWFERVGERLVDMGSPMVEGSVVRSDGTTTDTATGLNGYSIIRVADRDEALGLLKDHPLRRLGGEYAIEIFEVPRK